MAIVNNDEVPIGFSMALAKDINALNAFSQLNDESKIDIINQSKQIQSKQDMQQFVSHLTSDVNQTF